MNKLFLILFFVFFSTSVFSTEEKLIIRVCKTDLNFNPFTNFDDTGIWQLKLKNAVENLPVIIDYHEAPRKRCLLETQRHSRSDAVFAAITPERKTYLSYPTDLEANLGEVKFMVYVNKNSKIKWDGKKFENLEDGAVGFQDGFRIMEMLDDLKVRRDGVATSEKNFEKLKIGRLSAVIAMKEQYQIYSKSHSDLNFDVLDQPFLKATIYLGFSTPFYQSHQNIINKIWSKLKKTK